MQQQVNSLCKDYSDRSETELTGKVILAAIEAQILSYLRLSSYKVGLLINFNVKLLKQGIRRFID